MLFKKFWKIRGHLKIEVTTVFLIGPFYLMMIGLSTFELEKACRVNLRINTEVCDNLNNVPYKEMCHLFENKNSLEKSNENETVVLEKIFEVVTNEGHHVKDLNELKLVHKVCDAEKESQKVVSKLYAFRSPIATTFTMIIVTFAGVWSDKFNIRKAFILLPFVGESIFLCIYIVSSIYMNEIPIEYALFPASLASAIIGTKPFFTIGVYSYMSMQTKPEDRTFRMGFYSMFNSFLGILLSPLSGVLFTVLSYTQLFSLCLTMFFFGFLFVLFFIPEIKKQGNSTESEVPDEKTEASKDVSHNLCTKFFDPSHIKEALRVLVVKREANYRKILLLLIVLNIIICAPVGEDELYILFSRVALNWTTEFSYFVTFYTIIGLIGTGLATVVFSKMLNWSDPILGAISAFGSFIANPIIAFSTTNLLIYSYVIVDTFYYVRYVVVKSMFSKFVSDDELGRIYSLLTLTENMVSIISIPIYNLIYYNTLDTCPGAFFLFSMVFLAGAFVVFIYLNRLMKNMPATGKLEPTDTKEGIKSVD